MLTQVLKQGIISGLPHSKPMLSRSLVTYGSRVYKPYHSHSSALLPGVVVLTQKSDRISREAIREMSFISSFAAAYVLGKGSKIFFVAASEVDSSGVFLFAGGLFLGACGFFVSGVKDLEKWFETEKKIKNEQEKKSKEATN